MNNYQKDLIIKRLDKQGSHDYYEWVPALNKVFEILGYKERVIYDDINGAQFVDEETVLYNQSDEGLL